MFRQLDHLTGQQIERPALTAFRAGSEQTVATSNAVSLQDSLRSGSRTRFFAQCEIKVAFHEAPFGPVNRGPPNRDTVRDRLVADPRVGSQQNFALV